MNFISNFFKRINFNSVSKEDYWRKWEYFELLEDLHKALGLLSEYEGGNSGDFLSAQDFHLALEDAIDDVEFGNNDDLSKFWIWFAPTSVWDDFVGEKGADLGNSIFERVDKWKKANS